VIEALAEVYHHDKKAKEEGLSADQRLRFHQDHSGPVMARLKDCCKNNSINGRSSQTPPWERLSPIC